MPTFRVVSSTALSGPDNPTGRLDPAYHLLVGELSSATGPSAALCAQIETYVSEVQRKDIARRFRQAVANAQTPQEMRRALDDLLGLTAPSPALSRGLTHAAEALSSQIAERLRATATQALSRADALSPATPTVPTPAARTPRR